MTTTDLTRVDVDVSSLARPSSEGLLQAREAIKGNEGLGEVFITARDEGWTAASLAEALVPGISQALGHDATEEARYLADEYLQVGNAMLIISTETGKAIARVTDEDIWVPKRAPRHEMPGVMTQARGEPLAPRLRPELEGYLIWKLSEEERDQNLFHEMMARVQSTDLIGPENDRRLNPVTRKGRKAIVEEIRDALPYLLPGRASGAARTFLDCLTFVEVDPLPEGLVRMEGTLEARVTVPVQDPKAFNLRHDVPTRIIAVLAARWSRSLASALAGEATPQGTEAPVAWLAPATYAAGLSGQAPVLVIEGEDAVGLSQGAGFVRVDRSAIKCAAREVHDRLEVAASIPYTIWVDTSRMVAAPAVKGQESFVAELVR